MRMACTNCEHLGGEECITTEKHTHELCHNIPHGLPGAPPAAMHSRNLFL